MLRNGIIYIIFYLSLSARAKIHFNDYYIHSNSYYNSPMIRSVNDRKVSPTTKHTYRYKVDLDTGGRYTLRWDIDTVSKIIKFRLEADVAKDDLLGFGFSDYGESENADFIVIWTDLEGRHHFQDTHTDTSGLLSLDSHMDYKLTKVDVSRRGYLVIDFERLFDTCDSQDYLIDRGTTHMLIFTHPGAVNRIEGLNVPELQPILQRAQLLKSQLPDAKFPRDTQTFVMHVDNVTIPTQETTYWCAVRLLPEMKEKHHVIQFEGAISKAGRGVVHHLEVFHCEVDRGQSVPVYNGPCGSKSERPKGLESCRKVIGAWAMGAMPLSYPEQAGYPIGGTGYSRYVMLEVHYNNPELRSGIVDSSGIRFYVTKSLRRYDAGTMELGLEYTDKMALPPGLPQWSLTGYCISKCTQVGLPGSGIKVFASQLHTHLTGKKAFTKHYRGTRELSELNRDNHFSPHYQEIRKLHSQVTVLPGDVLVTTCVDSTKDRKNITLGGFAISDEMCVNYIHYYPAAELEVCKSSVTTESLYTFFRFLKRFENEKTSDSFGISKNYASINWTPMNIALLDNFYQTAPLSMQCNKSDGDRFPGRWENAAVPKVLFPLPPTSRECLLTEK